MAGKPVVAVDMGGTLSPEMYNFGSDDETGGYLMTKHLIQCGYDKILILAYSDVAMDHMRWRGYRKALNEAGLPYKKENFIILSDYKEKRLKNYDRLLKVAESGTALFFLSDMLAIEAIGYCQKKGYRVPEDFAIVGYDDIPAASMIYPELTTIRQNIVKKGERTAQMMLDILAGKEPEERNVQMPVNLCIRSSAREIR